VVRAIYFKQVEREGERERVPEKRRMEEFKNFIVEMLSVQVLKRSC
jgi:hypothetical protein